MSTMDKIKAKVDNIIHPDKNTTTTGSTTGSTTHTGTSHTGTSHTGVTGTGAGSTNAGPHNSNLANKADPRVDSDLDGSRNAGLGAHNNAGHTGLTGASTTAGPHGSNLANKADPRVDSDLDGSRNFGASTTGGHSATAGSNYNNPQSGNLGPHSSAIANKLDPRVDSDADGSRNLGGAGATGGYGSTGAGYGSTGTGLTGTGHSHTGTGTGLTGTGSSHTGAGYGSTGTGLTGTGHSHTGTGSGLTGTGSSHTGTGLAGGPGPAPNTAGPHSSDMLNKVDPRVDSDLDGSKTYGGNATSAAIDDANESDPDKITEAPPRIKVKIEEIDDEGFGSQHDNTPGDTALGSSPPDAAAHTPSKFLDKQVRQSSVNAEDYGSDFNRRHKFKQVEDVKASLEKYGSGK